MTHLMIPGLNVQGNGDGVVFLSDPPTAFLAEFSSSTSIHPDPLLELILAMLLSQSEGVYIGLNDYN
jgi:hypothetical protein